MNPGFRVAKSFAVSGGGPTMFCTHPNTASPTHELLPDTRLPGIRSVPVTSPRGRTTKAPPTRLPSVTGWTYCTTATSTAMSPASMIEAGSTDWLPRVNRP